MDRQSETPAPSPDGFGLLDMLVIIAEAWRPLLIVPLVAGAVAFAWTVLLPRPPVYIASATITMETETAAIVMTPGRLITLADLPPNLETQPIISAAQDETPGVYRIAVDKLDADQALSVLNNIVTKLTGEAFEDEGRELLEQRIRATSARVESLNRVIADLEKSVANPGATASTSGSSPLAQAVDTLSTANIDSQLAIAQDQQRLNAWPKSSVLVPPALVPQTTLSSPRTIVAYAVLISGFLVLVIIFARDFWRRAEADEQSAAKIARLRRALSLRRPAR